MSALTLRSLPLPAGLETKYTVHKLVIISSSKISQKVAQVLGLLGLGSESPTILYGDSAPALPPDVKDTDAKDTAAKDAVMAGDAGVVEGHTRVESGSGKEENGKKVIVALTATSTVASKLITTVEIVKREIASRRKVAQVNKPNLGTTGSEQEKGKTKVSGTADAVAGIPHIHTYCALTGIDPPIKTTPTISGGGETGGKKRKRGGDADGEENNAGEQQQLGDEKNAETEEAEEDGFETLKRPETSVAVDGSGGNDGILRKKKQHLLPVLTIYIAVEAVPALRELYG